MLRRHTIGDRGSCPHGTYSLVGETEIDGQRSDQHGEHWDGEGAAG